MLRQILTGMLFVALAGCAQMPPKVCHPISEKDRRAKLRTIDHWIARGTIISQAGKQRQKANFRWKQQGQQYTLNISGPLGLGGMRIKSLPEGGVELTQGNGDVLQFATPEALMKQKIGWALPLESMQDWLRGLPHQGKAKLGITWDSCVSLGALTLRMPKHIKITHLQWQGDLDITSWEFTSGKISH